jgi:hypothetical protein
MPKEFARRVAAALAEVTTAERDLDELLRRIQVAPRSEKTTVSKTVEEALARLRLARTDLIDLQRLMAEEETP